MSVRRYSRDSLLTNLPEKEQYYPRRRSSRTGASPNPRRRAKSTSGVLSSQKPTHPVLLSATTSALARSAEGAVLPTDEPRGKGTKHLSEGAQVKEFQHDFTYSSSIKKDLWSPEDRPIVFPPSAGQTPLSPQSPSRSSSAQDQLAPALPASTAVVNPTDRFSSTDVDCSKGQKVRNFLPKKFQENPSGPLLQSEFRADFNPKKS